MYIQNNDFWSHVDVKGEDDCWLWKGATSPNGFGVTGTKDKHYTAHVYAWYLEHGEFPEKQLQHTCSEKLCVNFRHLKIRQAPPDEERFWEMVDRRGDDECWPWLRKITKSRGTGAIRLSDGRTVQAFKYVTELETGVKSVHDVFYNVCGDNSCCNPKHWKFGLRDGTALFWSQVKKTDDDSCWEWEGVVNEQGYGRFWNDGKHYMAHRFAWEAVNGPIPEGMNCLHKCDNPTCVRVEKGESSHIFIGTQQDNVDDKMAKGRHRVNPLKGEDCSYSKLTEQDVVAIRSATGITQKALSDKYGVKQSTICNIIHRKIWKHVP